MPRMSCGVFGESECTTDSALETNRGVCLHVSCSSNHGWSHYRLAIIQFN